MLQLFRSNRKIINTKVSFVRLNNVCFLKFQNVFKNISTNLRFKVRIQIERFPSCEFNVPPTLCRSIVTTAVCILFHKKRSIVQRFSQNNTFYKNTERDKRKNISMFTSRDYKLCV